MTQAETDLLIEAAQTVVFASGMIAGILLLSLVIKNRRLLVLGALLLSPCWVHGQKTDDDIWHFLDDYGNPDNVDAVGILVQLAEIGGSMGTVKLHADSTVKIAADQEVTVKSDVLHPVHVTWDTKKPVYLDRGDSSVNPLWVQFLRGGDSSTPLYTSDTAVASLLATPTVPTVDGTLVDKQAILDQHSEATLMQTRYDALRAAAVAAETSRFSASWGLGVPMSQVSSMNLGNVTFVNSTQPFMVGATSTQLSLGVMAFRAVALTVLTGLYVWKSWRQLTGAAGLPNSDV